MHRTNTGRGGWMVVDSMIALVILGIALGGFALAQGAAAEVNRFLLARQRCILAAEAQLDSIAATGAAVGKDRFAKAWPNVRTEVTKTPGKGEWAGLVLVKVVASTDSPGRDVRVELARYIRAEKAEGGK